MAEPTKYTEREMYAMREANTLPRPQAWLVYCEGEPNVRPSLYREFTWSQFHTPVWMPLVFERSAAPAPTPSEDARMLDWLETQKEAYGFADVHEGNNWLVEGPYRTLREAILAAMSADSKGEAR